MKPPARVMWGKGLDKVNGKESEMFRLVSMYKKYANLVSLLGSWASLLALLLMLHPAKRGLSVIHWFLIVLAVFFMIVSFLVEVRKTHRIRIIGGSDKNKINQYMLKWIGNSGQVAIFSRDMTFAADKEIKKLLLSKSEKREVTICLPKEVSLTGELKKKGATIHAYSTGQDFNPRTRFTVANYGQGKKERVAVAHGEDGFHVIEEFGKDDLVIYLTEDLMNLAIKLAERNVGTLTK